MGLQAVVKAAAKTGFKVAGDVKEIVTYKRRTATAYNATSGGVSDTETTVTGLQIVLSDPTQGYQPSPKMVDFRENRSEEFDRKALILQADLAFRPEQEDQIILVSGMKYQVIKVSEDPARATWSLRLKLLP